MREVIKKEDNCRLCNSKRLEMVHQLAPSPVADSYLKHTNPDPSQELYPMELYLCMDCGHVQVLDMISPELIYSDYLYVTESSLGLVEHFKGNRDWILEHYTFPQGSLSVDAGSNDGTLVRLFQEKGFRSLGVEPAPHIAKLANERGAETVNDYLTVSVAKKMVEKYGKAKLITMNNVVSNVENLHEIMRAVDELLDKDGLYVFETFYFPASIKNMVFDFQYHEHLNYFTLNPLVKFFKQFGMEMIRVKEINTKGGSIRCVVQRIGGKYPVHSSIGELMANEDRIGVNQMSDLYPQYKKRIDTQKNKTMEYLNKLKREGKKIAAFGASATSTTLIYHYGMENMFEFIADDNPAKIGTFSPGARIPVYSSAALMEKKPDAVVVLAWRYIEAIKAKNQNYLDQGGEFILPLEEFRVIKS